MDDAAFHVDPHPHERANQFGRLQSIVIVEKCQKFIHGKRREFCRGGRGRIVERPMCSDWLQRPIRDQARCCTGLSRDRRSADGRPTTVPQPSQYA